MPLDDAQVLLTTAANRERLAEAQHHWNEITETALRRGFYGMVAIVLTIADGTIQKVESNVFRKRWQPDE